MKKITYIAVMMLVVLSFSACKKGPDKIITGKWKLTDISMPGMEEAAKTEYMANRIFTFMENGNYEITAGADGKSEGTWETSEDGKTITTKSPDGKVNTSVITEISDDKLVLTEGDTKMVFEKIKE